MGLRVKVRSRGGALETCLIGLSQLRSSLKALDLMEEVAPVQRVVPRRAIEAQVVPTDGGVREFELRKSWALGKGLSFGQGTNVDDGVALVDAVVVKPVLAVGQVVHLGPDRGALLEQRGDPLPPVVIEGFIMKEVTQPRSPDRSPLTVLSGRSRLAW